MFTSEAAGQRTQSRPTQRRYDGINSHGETMLERMASQAIRTQIDAMSAMLEPLRERGLLEEMKEARKELESHVISCGGGTKPSLRTSAAQALMDNSASRGPAEQVRGPPIAQPFGGSVLY